MADVRVLDRLSILLELPMRLRVTITAGKRISQRWNGAGDLIAETIETADRLTGGFINKATGGRVRGPCAGCNHHRATLNERVKFVE